MMMWTSNTSSPKTELGTDYIWSEKNIYIDLVVRKVNEYLPIELKYATKQITEQISRFGEKLDKKIAIVKSQGAQNFIAYNFWKDVRRLELVKKRFKANVNHGLAVMLTNDPSYQRGRSSWANCEEMSMEAGKHGRSRHWHRPPAGGKDKFNFDLDAEYTIDWHTCKLHNHDFQYCVVEV